MASETNRILEATSVSNGPERNPTPLRQEKHISTSTAYELWAPQYDSDGNFLQALDTLELQTLLPEFLLRVQSTKESRETDLKIVDLGCGTGRNTLQLASLGAKYNIKEIVGLDFSPSMLTLARKKVEEAQQALAMSQPQPIVHLAEYDLSSSTAIKDLPAIAKNPDAVVSTLVLEHIQVDQFFSVCAALVEVGSRLLITNMHSEMGAISGAGFVDPKTGNKIKAESFAHTVSEVVKAAQKYGFDVEGKVLEKGVDSEALVERLGSRSRKWFEKGVKTWFAIEFVRREG